MSLSFIITAILLCGCMSKDNGVEVTGKADLII